MKTIKLIACFALVTLFHFSVKAQVTGRNVTFVTAYKGVKAEGLFYQSGPKEWKESKGGSRVHATFKETNRDKWSVYLKDASRRIRVQLNLHTKKIIINDEVFYTIGQTKAEIKSFNQNNSRNNYENDNTRTTSTTLVNGKNLTYVRISEKGRVIGAFKQTAYKQWTEYKGTREHAKFTESSRDAWSVYLKDASRGINVQIDLHRKKVLVNNTSLYTTSRPSAKVSYNSQNTIRIKPTQNPLVTTYNNRKLSNPTITKKKNKRMKNGNASIAKKKVNGRNVKIVSFGDGNYYLGQFIQMDNSKNWYVKSIQGHTEDYLKETDRDEWSVYLSSTKSNKKVQINLRQKKITVKSNGKTTRYNIRNSIAK